MRSLGIAVLLVLMAQGIAWAEPDYNALADAIYKAEGGSKTAHPYGIMTRYKVTTARQACINTCKTKYRAWEALGRKGGVKGYLAYLGSKYAPIGAKNDPNGLNRNWVTNVSKLYKGGV